MTVETRQGCASGTEPPPFRFCTLKSRAEFKAASDGFRVSMAGFTVLRKPGPAEPGLLRIGLTVTKKLGNAVVRNRIRRRLRAALQAVASSYSGPPLAGVVLARQAVLTMPFATIVNDLARALAQLATRPEAGRSRPSA